jgi:lipopolysaccharide transport system permease protein
MTLTERCATDGRWTNDRLLPRLLGQRELLREWGRREASIRYRQSLLGIGWAVVQPLATLAVFGFVLAGLLDIQAPDGLPYASFAFAGIVPWTLVASSISSGVPSLVNSSSLISKLYFPREVVPLSIVLACVLDLVVATAMFLVLIGLQGIEYQPSLAALPLVDLVLVVWVAAITVFGAAITVFVRDLRHAVPFLLQLAFFASPIMYPATVVSDDWIWIESVNPLAYTAKATREVALVGMWPNWVLLVSHLIVATGVLLAAIAYTRSVEPRMVDLA